MVWNQAGFFVVGTDSDGGTLTWQSEDGSDWNLVAGPFTEMTVDGVEAFDDSFVVFGRNPLTGALVVWESRDLAGWDEGVVSTGLHESSQIRSITEANGGFIAVGVDGSTHGTLVWASSDGMSWELTATIPKR